MLKVWRFLGIDDSFRGKDCVIVGCVTQGNAYVDGFMVGRISVDGLDSTQVIVKMVSKSKFRRQIKCIFLNGITFGGFNIADIHEIYEKLNIPVVVVMRRMPDFDAIFDALKNFEDGDVRKEMIEKAGKVYKAANLFIQISGCSLDEALEFLKKSKLKGNVPEALRLAHLVASSIIHGESKGRA